MPDISQAASDNMGTFAVVESRDEWLLHASGSSILVEENELVNLEKAGTGRLAGMRKNAETCGGEA